MTSIYAVENIKEQYPEIAKMTVYEIINSEEFKTQYEKTLVSFKVETKYFHAFKSLKNTGMLEFETFVKEYISCIDKESNLPFAKRVVIYSLGNSVYAKTIKQLMTNYDNTARK